jgi:hypothetical protein
MRPPAVDQAIGDAIRPAMNRLGAQYGCPPLSWHLRGTDSSRPGTLSGMAAPSRFSRDEAVAALNRWAALLGLHDASDQYIELCFTGEVDCHPVEIWWLPPAGSRSRAVQT